jgi:hypothetical protein
MMAVVIVCDYKMVFFLVQDSSKIYVKILKPFSINSLSNLVKALLSFFRGIFGIHVHQKCLGINFNNNQLIVRLRCK